MTGKTMRRDPWRVSMSRHEEGLFRIEMANYILKYLRMGIWIAMITQVYRILRVLYRSKGSLAEVYERNDVFLSCAIILISVLCFIIMGDLKKKLPDSAKMVIRLEVGYCFILLLWASTASMYHQNSSESMMEYVMWVLAISAVAYLPIPTPFILFLAPQLLMSRSFPIFRQMWVQNSDVYIDVIVMTVMAILLSCYRSLHERRRFRDRRLIQEQSERLMRIAYRDSLTDLWSRRFLDEQMRFVCHKCIGDRGNLAMILIDVDNFKRYNEYWGHQKGDECLGKIAHALKIALGEEGDLVRYGGEEFLAVIRVESCEQAASLSECMHRAVNQLKLPYREESDLMLSTSIGVEVGCPQSEHSWKELAIRADEALSLAKMRGKNQIVYAWEVTGEEEELAQKEKQEA